MSIESTREPVAKSSGWLLVRRHGGLWGVPHGSVRELFGGRPPRLELRNGETIVADELLHLAAELETSPFPRAARPFYREAILGLAVWGEEPVILLNAGAPPAFFHLDPGPSEIAKDGHETR